MCKRVTEAIAGLKAQNAPPIGPPDPPACEHGVSFYPNGGMSARCSQCPSGKPEARKATKVANLKKSSEQSTVHSAPEGKTQGGAAG